MAVGKKSIQRVSRMATDTEEITNTEQSKETQTENMNNTDSIQEEKFKMIHSIKSELPPYLL